MNEIVTFKDIEKVFHKFLLLEDKDFIRLTYAAVIGNQMPNQRPIWLMLVGPSSSGKTTALNAFNGIKLKSPKTGEIIEPTHNISDLTENSFASGMSRGDKQTSLLNKMPFGGVMVFKDFTSMISKNEQSRMTIMGQLREIYDGSYTKRTGNGEDVIWNGKIGAIAGVTEAIFQHMESMSAMGDRFVLYQVKQPDRTAVTKFKVKQMMDGVTEFSELSKLKEMTENYFQRAFNEMSLGKSKNIQFNHEQINEIVSVADFCTMVRSGMIMDRYRNRIMFVPTPEMPMRMFEQMYAIATTFMFMRKLDDPECEDTITKEDFGVIYKIAFDSIPVVRRIALEYLTLYDGGVTTAALARKINYESEVVAGWLAQLNSLGIVKRLKHMTGGNAWKLEDKYREVMQKLSHLKALGESLEEEGGMSTDSVERHWENNRSFERTYEEPDPYTAKEAEANGEEDTTW